MEFDTLIANAGRLRILTALAAEPVQDFVWLRQATRLTDGNLSSHARRLAQAGLVRIDKAIRDGKPVTTFVLTGEGRRRLTEHVSALVEAVRAPAEQSVSAAVRDVDEWID
jgi:DNA-binding transcriptional ArsR family regulator